MFCLCTTATVLVALPSAPAATHLPHSCCFVTQGSWLLLWEFRKAIECDPQPGRLGKQIVGLAYFNASKLHSVSLIALNFTANVGHWTAGIWQSRERERKKANALLMQAISDPNGCRQGGVAISMVAIAVFLSVDANFSEKFKVLCVSSFCFTLDLNHTCFPWGWGATLGFRGSSI